MKRSKFSEGQIIKILKETEITGKTGPLTAAVNFSGVYLESCVNGIPHKMGQS